jgi:hypothetical protein
MKMPLKFFWLYVRMVERLEADEDIRMLALMTYSQTGEGIKEIHERLSELRGQIQVYQPEVQTLNLDDDSLDPTFDKAALDALKASIRRGKPKKETEDDSQA